MALNLHKLFYHISRPSFYSNLLPIPAEVDALKTAKNEIRDHLRRAIPEWLEQKLGEKPEHPPRFRTQGSWAYETCNRPCRYPPQEMDWDLGSYLPISQWDDSVESPRKAAREYYAMVKEIMTPFAASRGWSIKDKPTCVRVVLNNGTKAHVDIPLYAAPDKDFLKITEAVKVAKSLDTARADSAFIDSWRSLTRISLACQDGSWKSSDPGLVVRWFDSKINRHGPQLRRICRYLKAWRDYQWELGGPSSLLLMVCAAQTLDRTVADVASRDDLALRFVLEALPTQLRDAVKEPMINPNEDLNKLEYEARKDAAWRAASFLQSMNQALTTSHAEANKAMAMIQTHLGSRFPIDPEGVTPEDGPPNIRVVPADVGTKQVIPTTKAG